MDYSKIIGAIDYVREELLSEVDSEKQVCSVCGKEIDEHIWCDELVCFCSLDCRFPLREERILFIAKNYSDSIIAYKKSIKDYVKWKKAMRDEMQDIVF